LESKDKEKDPKKVEKKAQEKKEKGRIPFKKPKKMYTKTPPKKRKKIKEDPKGASLEGLPHNQKRKTILRRILNKGSI
jgi:hypothetical protein